MVDGWVRKGFIVMVVAAGLILGRIDGAARVGGGSRPDPQIAQTQEQLNRELFEAVRSWLAAAHVAQQNMPKQIISVELTGPQRYKIHMQMIEGQGWFEVWRDGTNWRVKGLPVPSGPGGGGG
jgi:ribosomal protein S12 methylthiotransferase accessory factor YcaO